LLIRVSLTQIVVEIVRFYVVELFDKMSQ